MGVRKHKMSVARKAEKEKVYAARLNDCPTSPQKMRQVADLIRGIGVEHALSTLEYSKYAASKMLFKLLKSAIANWQVKNAGVRMDDANLFVKSIFVDGGRALKRISPAPQGRAYRVRKRSNHITLVIDSKNKS